MTRVRLPPDPSSNNCITTIVDSSSALLAGGMGDIDCIVLVYDLDRVETFYRLENHWLPLIERCFSGEVRAHNEE